MTDKKDTISLLKTLFIPALLSLTIFLLLTYIIIPFHRRHRATYAQYSPLRFRPLGSFDFRERFYNLVNRREDAHLNESARGIDTHDEEILEGEELDEVDDHMRLVIQSHARAVATRERLDSLRRLNRDLEEGFRDDSDDEP